MTKRTVLPALLAFILMIAGCASPTPSGPNGDLEPIRVGVVTALSGNLAPIGTHIRQGLELAANEINEAGGVDGRDIVLVIEDSKGTPAEAVNAVTKIIPDLHVLHGPLTSSEVLAVMPLIEEAGITDITNSASAPEITRSGNPFMFRLHVSESTQAAKLVDYALNQLGFTRIAILHDSGDYGRSGKDALLGELEKAGLTPVAIETFASGDVDFSAQILRVAGESPEAVIVWGFVNEDARIAIQLNELGVDTRMMINNVITNPQLLELVGEAGNGVIGVVAAVPDQSQERVSTFWNKYQMEYDVEPALHAYESYDAMYVIADAVRRAGSLDRQAIRDAVAATDIEGISGRIRFDEFGDFIQALILGEIQNGQFVEIAE